MIHVRPQLLPILCAVALASCASTGTTAHEQAGPNYAHLGHCDGKGELFHWGSTAVPSFPANATITRRVIYRGVEGVCYTTPQSLQAATQRADPS